MSIKRKIFADTEFTLSGEEVAEARQAELQNLKEIQQILANQSESEAMRTRIQQRKEDAEKRVRLYEDHDGETILGIARTLFEKGAELEARDMPVDEFVPSLYGEVPEADLMYELLRRDTWGYRLGQARTALRFEEKENRPKAV